jgi:predicted XRE-type DNA-binding protein
MSKTFEINIKKLQDPTGSKQDVKKMKLGAIFYLKQLGFNQYDISTMIDIKRPTVQSIISRVLRPQFVMIIWKIMHLWICNPYWE